MTRFFSPLLWGFLGSTSLFVLYLATMMLLTGSLESTASQFRSLWYYMVPLIVGFGVQVGLYMRLKHIMKGDVSKPMMAANTTSSAVSMIACCAHHITDIAPLIGITALSTFLTNFQKELLLVSILLNFVGILYILKMNSRYNLL
ncbi:MAG TPA: hypothetical protein VJ184_11120 [Chryseolinea sp.]|nr:hypothetical protein [Chryseolinea sp.]